MNIGIMTFHRAVNYGAVLQAYALQKKLETYGNKVEIIDYRCSKIEEEISPFDGFRKNIGTVNSIKKMIFRTIKNMKFADFYRHYLSLSSPCYNELDLKKNTSKYNVLITGSDQVWNFGCSGSDKAYFLDFANNAKKYSYAASFGYDKLPEADPFDYKNLLEDFSGISVRENTAVSIVNEKSGKDAMVTLDPTLLLDLDDWKSLVSKERPIKEKYLFIYYIREPKDLLKYAEKVAKEKGLKIINAKKSKEFLMKCSPSDFLSWIYYSECFVTNSFHGTVFSILFHKKFAIELDNGKSINNRSKELMALLDVNGRELDINNIDKMWDDIDYTHIDTRLVNERNNSLEFLREISNS